MTVSIHPTAIVDPGATFGEQVVDTFYVKDMFGLKFHQESRRQALEKKLREAIIQGVERAKS